MNTHTDYEIVNAALLWHESATAARIEGTAVKYIINGLVQEITGWTVWRGGECPVLMDTSIEIMWRDGCLHADAEAGVLGWDHDGSLGDIIAYRIAEALRMEAQR